eukprot:TRINITY_DN2321_c3_g1_i1.p3 TRINITY_DN2321_c3_g1~~TRINITY_DN2321_c3_g1_i1.p3  ORF type:complete len:170 (+),score=51.03 TRINITY_DN2321_c3_g1_i1:94-603(+)
MAGFNGDVVLSLKDGAVTGVRLAHAHGAQLQPAQVHHHHHHHNRSITSNKVHVGKKHASSVRHFGGLPNSVSSSSVGLKNFKGLELSGSADGSAATVAATPLSRSLEHVVKHAPVKHAAPSLANGTAVLPAAKGAAAADSVAAVAAALPVKKLGHQMRGTTGGLDFGDI